MAWDFLPEKQCPLQKEKQSHRERKKPLLLPRENQPCSHCPSDHRLCAEQTETDKLTCSSQSQHRHQAQRLTEAKQKSSLTGFRVLGFTAKEDLKNKYFSQINLCILSFTEHKAPRLCHILWYPGRIFL